MSLKNPLIVLTTLMIGAAAAQEIPKLSTIDSAVGLRGAPILDEERQLLYTLNEKNVVVYDLKTQQAVKTFPVTQSRNFDMQLSQDGRTLFITTNDALQDSGSPLLILDTTTWQPVPLNKTTKEVLHYMRRMTMSPDASQLAFAYDPSHRNGEGKALVYFLDLKTQAVTEAKVTGGVMNLQHAPDGKHLAVATTQGLYWMDTSSKTVVKEFAPTAFNQRLGYPGPSLTFSPDGKTLAAGMQYTGVVLWDTRTGSLVKEFKTPPYLEHFVQYSPNGKYLLTGNTSVGNPPELVILDTTTWQELPLKKYGGYNYSATFTQDGKKLYLTANDGIRVYDTSQLNPMDSRVLVNVDPQDAQWTLNGQKPRVGQDGVVNVFTGVPLEVQVTKPFFKTFTTTLNLKAGETKNLNVLLERDKGTLSLTSSPRGASVWIDGEEKGKTPLKLSKFDAGEYTVTLKLNDHKEFTQRVTVQGGQDNAVNAALVLSPGIKITSKPTGAQVMIGDQVVCEKTPCTLRNLPPSIQEFTFKLDGYPDLKAKAVVPEEGTGNLDVTLKK